MAKKQAKQSNKGKPKERKKPKETPAQQRTKSAKVRFLAAVREVLLVSAASKMAGVSKQSHYNWLAKDSEYRKDYEAACDSATHVLEDEARRRACGYLRSVRYKGKVVGREYEYSDQLLMFTLKAARPEKYRERHDIDLRLPSDQLDRELAAALAELAATPQAIIDQASQGTAIEDQASVPVLPTHSVAPAESIPPAE